MEKGHVQVYTGDGKGKTTAALGLSLRAVCCGKRVFFAQFMKGMDYSELKADQLLDLLTIKQYGRDCFVYNEASQEDVEKAKAGLEEVKKILWEGLYDVVVLDEINIAFYYQLFHVNDMIEILKKRKPHVEVIMTGRNAPKEMIEFADLVTEMKEIKHYYQKGVKARRGIEK